MRKVESHTEETALRVESSIAMGVGVGAGEGRAVRRGGIGVPEWLSRLSVRLLVSAQVGDGALSWAPCSGWSLLITLSSSPLPPTLLNKQTKTKKQTKPEDFMSSPASPGPCLKDLKALGPYSPSGVRGRGWV